MKTRNERLKFIIFGRRYTFFWLFQIILRLLINLLAGIFKLSYVNGHFLSYITLCGRPVHNSCIKAWLLTQPLTTIKVSNLQISSHRTKMYRNILIVLLVPVVSGFLLDTIGLSTKVTTVTELDVSKYLGRWYQMYASQSVYATFERKAICVTADCKYIFSHIKSVEITK